MATPALLAPLLTGIRRRWPLFYRRAPDFWQLMRMHRPIGFLLLLWPTLWCLWIAGEGTPSIANVVIFVLGTLCMRAAGCCINDYADRNFDGKVKRTAQRPLVSGRILPSEALRCCAALCVVSFLLVLLTNTLTIMMSVGGLALALVYPFMKRHTHMAQVVLGAAFSWGGMMAFTAEAGTLPPEAWLLYVGNVLWTVVYDTEYAMVDRDDDIRIGIRTSAITFGRYDVLMVMLSYAAMLLVLGYVGYQLGMGWPYYAGLLLALAIAGYHYTLIRTRTREGCFRAFNHNNWLGAAVFAGIAGEYWRLLGSL